MRVTLSPPTRVALSPTPPPPMHHMEPLPTQVSNGPFPHTHTLPPSTSSSLEGLRCLLTMGHRCDVVLAGELVLRPVVREEDVVGGGGEQVHRSSFLDSRIQPARVHGSLVFSVHTGL